jgi:hypothetical protein
VTRARRLILAGFAAISLLSSVAPSFAQVPGPVPALPDAERRTSYTLTASNCSCGVGFALYGDGTDFNSWVEVYLNGVRVNYNDGTFGWTITSPSGPLSNLARPITDGILTFNSAQTGTVQIVGARRPRRSVVFQEGRGVTARDLNYVLNDIYGQNREEWDLRSRILQGPPGTTYAQMPAPSVCINGLLGFDSTGLKPVCTNFAGFGQVGANLVWAGPSSGSNAIPTFRVLTGADLPNPSASSLGGVQSLTCSTSNWFNVLSTGGVFACSQPNFSDLAGSLQASQVAANFITNAKMAQAGAATLKGNPTNATANVQDFTIQGLVARGAPDATNDKIPLYDNAAGTIKYVTPANIAASGSLPSIGNKQILANTSGTSAAPIGTDPSTWFDSAYCNTIGYLIVRTTGAWTCSKSIAANPVWWGADPSGVSDSTSALNSALAASTSIEFPAGKFLFNSNIVVEFPNSAGWTATSTTSNTVGTGAKTFTVASGLTISNGSTATAYVLNASGVAGSMTGTVTSYSGTTLVLNIASVTGSGTFTGWNIVQNYLASSFVGSVSLRGAGADVTTLYFPASNGFNVNYRSQQHSLHVNRLSITTGSTDPGATRAAFLLQNFYPFFGTFVAQSDFRDVTCRGDDGYAKTFYWGYCLLVSNVSDITFDNFNAYGDGSGTHGTGISFNQPGAGCFSAPTTCGTVYNISNSNFSFLGLGINYGANTQTVQVSNSFFAQTTTGIFVPSSGGTLQGLNVSNSTFFTIGNAIASATPLPNLILSGSFMGCGTGFYCVDILQENTTIIGNHFIPRGAANSSAGGVAIRAGNTGSITAVLGNTFSSVGQAQFYTAGTGGISTQSNVYTGNTGTVGNASAAACPPTTTANCVGGGSS